jgi:hypothetical protein
MFDSFLPFKRVGLGNEEDLVFSISFLGIEGGWKERERFQ